MLMRDFVDRYAGDPALFVSEMLGVDATDYQRQVLEWVRDGERRISFASGHGVGKSCLLSWLICWHTLTRFPQKTLASSPTIQQLNNALAAETKKWFRALPTPVADLVEITTESIRLKAAPTESFVTFQVARAEAPESIAGLHSENVLLVFDESSGIPEKTFESSAGSMSAEHAHTILAGNPVRSSGFFYDTHNRLAASWKTLRVSSEDSALVSPKFAEEMESRYGRESNEFRVRVQGLWPLADEDSAIPLGLVEDAAARDVEDDEAGVVIGVDVARYGSDSSAIVVRQGRVVLDDIRTYKQLDTMSLVGRIRETMKDYAKHEIVGVHIDSIGIGSGCLDRLLELDLDVTVLGINVAESPSLGSDYLNLRAELYFAIKAWLETRDVKIPVHDGLLRELTTPRYSFNSTGKRKLESKEEMRRRGVGSPDIADALALTFAGDAMVLGGRGTPRQKGPLKRGLRGVV
jgi:hypothetical protein